jgi:KipI family sensor histidine kinase inhibitor
MSQITEGRSKLSKITEWHHNEILRFAQDDKKVNVRYLSCGDTAFTVEFGNEISPEINGRVMALHAAVGAAKKAGSLDGVIETVPTMRSLMVAYNPLATSRAQLQPQIDALIAHGLPAALATRQVTIPCCYDGPDFAPDLAEVAERTKKTPEQVIAAHLASPFKVYVLGFMPGFAYVAGLEPTLYLPRRSQPRVRVPRSSVAIAMDMTTIYSFESPGGWHLIGRTPLWMFDQRREQPVFLAPGDQLSFRRIDRQAFDRIAAEVEAGTLDWSTLVRAT